MRCRSCGGELQSRKEKITGTCDICARSAHEGFEMMGKGKFKEGFKRVMNVRFAKDSDDERQRVVEEQMKVAMRKREKKIRKKLEKQVKKGKITQEEMEEGLKEFKRMNEGDDSEQGR